jgi:hypothetical protein
MDSLKRFSCRVINKTKAGWNWLADFHRERFIGNLSKEDHEARFQYDFTNAKTLSDFIGMIVRFSFATFAWKYFLQRAPQMDGIYRWAMGMCFVFACGVAFVLGARIFAIILFYETRALHKQTHKVLNVIQFVVATVTAFALWYGINDLVASLIKSGVTPK